jgi:hypothetical protein
VEIVKRETAPDSKLEAREGELEALIKRRRRKTVC